MAPHARTIRLARANRVFSSRAPRLPHVRHPKSQIRNRRAFTLIEAISCLVILAIAMPAMLWAIRDSVRRRADPVLLSRARWLAAEKLEDIIADAHSPTRGYSYVVVGNYAAENPVTGFTGMNRSVTVSETAPKYVAGTGWKTVTVSVQYTDGQGTSRTLSLATVVTSYTP